MAEKIVLVDGYSLLYRAFHALPLMDNGEGQYTNAIYGFLSMLLKVLSEEKPAYCAVAFDEHAPTFRHLRYEAYKAGRAPTPEEMRPQIPAAREILESMHIAQLSLSGYEADDILGTVSRLCEETGVDCLIVTGDRDSYQLAGERTTILYTKKGISETERVTPAWIQEKYGVTPTQMIDVKGLMGDSSDNIPGVPGVGEKTATKLVAQYGTLENALENAPSMKGALKQRLLDNDAQARESKFLATIDRRAPIDFHFEACRVGDLSGGLDAMRRLKLRSLIERVQAMKPEAPKPAEAAPAKRKTVSVEGADALKAQVARWFENPPEVFALHIGECLSAAADDGRRLRCELGGTLLAPGLTDEEIADALRPLEDANATRVVMHNMKAYPGDLHRFEGRADDTMLAAYSLNPQKNALAPEDVCAAMNLPFDADCPAASLLALADAQKEALARDGLTELYRTIEMPLMFVLRDMERAGFRVDADYLQKLGELYTQRLDETVERVRTLAGEAAQSVNLNSPKQLAKLLFEDLRIPAPGGKKNPGTSAEVLEELAADYPVCGLILEYRKYQKLNSTYVSALTRMRGADGRIHTSFEQAVTGTGRISSREPNLQNIPVRTELGREIRHAFVAEPGWQLVDADYSQIELRVLAHMSGDTGMQAAFLHDEDIHARTAAEVYGVPMEAVTREMRSAAKAVNFGIVYGISDFGLARNIGVTRRKAAEFIERYFSRYPGVKRYMDEQVRLGREQGYVTTLFGRRRYLPELESSVYTMRAFGERAAMNSPIQGTAADIIKLAMIRVHDALKARGLRARLILQVHDELIVEAPIDELDAVRALLLDGMESVVHLSVPLKAELSTGGNWNECKS